MTNKYPEEFEEIYQRVILKKEGGFNDIVVQDYFDMLIKENWTLLRTFHYFEKYVKEKQSKRLNLLDKMNIN